MTYPVDDIVKGFDPDKAIRPELNRGPTRVERLGERPDPVPPVEPMEKTAQKPRKPRNKSAPKRPATGKPRKCLGNDLLMEMANGPVSLSKLMKLATNKRSFYSRSSELRLDGLILDMLGLTPAGVKAAQTLVEQKKAWDEYLAAGGIDR